MYQRGIKLSPLSQALHELSGVKTVFLRRQTRRGSTHLLLVGQVSGNSFSRRIPEADPTRPEAALAKAVQLMKQIEVDGLSGSAFSVADRSLEAIHRRARQSIVAEERAELIRSSTAQSRLRWIQRCAYFLEDKGWGCDQRTLEQWILQTDRGSRERRERLTAARTLAEATGFEFVVKPDAKYLTKHAPLVLTKTIDEMATLAAPVTAKKDDAPAAVHAAIDNVAGLCSISGGGGLIQTTSG